MKYTLLIVLIMLSSCRTIDLDAKMPNNNGSCHVTYTGIGKSELSGLNANICGGSLGVEKSTWDSPIQAELIACLIAPQLCAK